MAKITDVPIITSNAITDNHVFVVATTSTTDQLSLNELQKSFTGLTARTTDGISILGKTQLSGITVGDNGYVGIDNFSPSVALDIGDQGSASVAEVRLSSRSSSRQASYTLKDASVWWRNTKKAGDTDFYIQTSTNGSNFTGVLNIDTNGNVGVFDGSSNLTDRFYVSGGTVKFQSGVSGIQFDPGVAEIKTTNAGDIFYINKSNTDDIVLGQDVLYIDNDVNPKIGLFTTGPSFPLHVKNSDIIASFDNTTTAQSNIKINNKSATGYISLNSSIFSFGRFAYNASSNLCYDLSKAYLGLGIISPSNKFHVYSSIDETLCRFEGVSGNSSKVYQLNNLYTGANYTSTGPWHTVYSFGRNKGTGSIDNSEKWGIGLAKDSYQGFDDSFVFRVNADTTTASAVKVEITKDGDIDIQGSFTTDGNYCKGKFIQVHQTRVTGNHIYFNPFYPNSNTNPSGHDEYNAPFGFCPYGGKVEKISLFSSDYNLPSLSNWRFEIVKNTLQTANSNIDYVSGFYTSPSSSPTTFPTSGIIADFNISSLSRNQPLTTNSSNMSGNSSFAAGDLLQYRIVSSNGTKSFTCDFTVTSVISYTVT